MTCKDCVHERVCNALCPKGLLPYQSSDYPAEVFCLEFKNKADFVEVVRCEKCKYGDVSTISKDRNGEEEIACYCTLKNRVTDLDSYCPSGKRK